MSDRGLAGPIRAVRAVVHRKRHERPQWNPRTRWAEKVVVLAVVETECGRHGVGEAYCDGGTPDSVVALIERDFGPQLVGADIRRLGALASQLRDGMVVSCKGGAAEAARSALDIALWDLLGKALGQPVHVLLGSQRERVPAYASAGLYGPGKGPADLAEEMAGYVRQGFRAVKIKVGGAPLREDVARVAAVREAIGPDISLMVDALYAYAPVDALRFARAVERHDIHFLEAPVPPGDIAGLAEVRQRSPIAIAGNEFAHGLDGFRRLIEPGGVDVVHLDAILCGGISEAMRIGALAASRHLPVSYHAASSAVCLAANLQAAAATPNAESVEMHMIHRLLFEQLPEGTFRLEEGCIVLPSAPGLGLGEALATAA